MYRLAADNEGCQVQAAVSLSAPGTHWAMLQRACQPRSATARAGWVNEGAPTTHGH